MPAPIETFQGGADFVAQFFQPLLAVPQQPQRSTNDFGFVAERAAVNGAGDEIGELGGGFPRS